MSDHLLHRPPIWIGATILVFALQPTRAVGQALAAPRDDVRIPSTPAGQELASWLRAFNESDSAAMRRFIADRFSAAALSEHSVSERVERERGTFARTRGVTVRFIDRSEPFEVVILGQEKLDETWVRMNLVVADSPPHLVTSYGVRRIDRPTQAGPAPRMSESELIRDLENYLERMAAGEQFSDAVLLAKNGRPLLKKAVGLASKEFGIRNNVDTKFNLASMNKMFTGVAIAQLVAAGKMSFDDTLGHLLPDYRNRDVASRVTVHQLLTHTSGLGDFFNRRFEATKTSLRSIDDYLSLFVDDTLLFKPGARWRYSNAGFIVLGAIIERLSGQDYFSYVRDHIYNPAGMANTDSYETDRDVPNRAIGYTEIGPDNRAVPGPLRNNLVINPVRGSSAGGGYSTLDDLLRFANALLDNKLIGKDITETLLSGKANVAPNERYAYGFMEGFTNGYRVLGHGGTAPAVNAKLDMFPELGYTFVVLSNYDPRSADRVADHFRERVTRR